MNSVEIYEVYHFNKASASRIPCRVCKKLAGVIKAENSWGLTYWLPANHFECVAMDILKECYPADLMKEIVYSKSTMWDLMPTGDGFQGAYIPIPFGDKK